jgi:hypothetical protein
MAACAHDLLLPRKTPSLITALKQLINAKTAERRVHYIKHQMRIVMFPIQMDFQLIH